MPSPRFWTRCASSVNGAMPIHCAPSPPICVMPVISPLPSGLSSTIVWQPMPAPTSVPSGRLRRSCCAGSPSRRTACAGAIGSSAGRPWISASLREARLHRVDPHAARGQPAGDRAGDQVGVEVELARQQRLAALVALAEHARRVRHAVERLLERASRGTGPSPRRRGSRRGRARTRARSPARAARSCRASGSRMPARSSAASVEAELAQRLQQVVVGLAGGDDAEPGVGRRPRCG